jgi:hypothetical protein
MDLPNDRNPRRKSMQDYFVGKGAFLYTGQMGRRLKRLGCILAGALMR